MSAAFTIILPHRRNDGNDAALAIALDCLMANTDHDFALLMDTCEDEPLYPIVNRMVRHAVTECCVYWSSDLFAAPGWDTPMLAAWEADRRHTIVTNVVVEPRAIAMHPENLERDFGRKPETFQRDAFEAYTLSAPVPDGIGWGTPYMISRGAFITAGGFRTDLPPDDDGFSGGDMLFFQEWREAGNTIVRARSYVYHLQRYSQEHEQRHEKRDVHS